MDSNLCAEGLWASHSLPTSPQGGISHSHHVQKKNRLFERLNLLVGVQKKLSRKDAVLNRSSEGQV